MSGNFPHSGTRKPPPESAQPSHWSHARVLVADDHVTFRLLLGSQLEKLGIDHRCCGDGQLALDALATERFDLVITDCRMPVLDGYAMTRELRRRERAAGSPPLCVLALTASLGPEDIRDCIECGMNAWLTKPIGYAQLREVLRRWLLPQREGPTVGQAMAAAVGWRSRPGRASLIETFGSWDVVEPMLFSLIQEAHADLAVLAHAQSALDATMAAQCLHRLVGSVAFLGETGVEGGALALIQRLQLTGVASNQLALNELRHDVERYLNYLAEL